MESVRGVLRRLDYIHVNRRIHHDIKPVSCDLDEHQKQENLLLLRDLTANIRDFGLVSDADTRSRTGGTLAGNTPVYGTRNFH